MLSQTGSTPDTLSGIFRKSKEIDFTKIPGGRSRQVYLVNGSRVPKVYKAQPNPGWHKLVDNREQAIQMRRLLLRHFESEFNKQNQLSEVEINLPRSKFNIINKGGESVVITIEEPMFDLYPGIKNGFIDLCSPEFGSALNGRPLKEIIQKNYNLKKDLSYFLNVIREKIRYPDPFLNNENITLVLDMYGLSNVIYKEGQRDKDGKVITKSKFIINNSAFKFDFDGIPISTRTIHYILKRLINHQLKTDNLQQPTEDEKYILRVGKTSMEWINSLCEFCNLPNIYRKKIIEQIAQYDRFF